MIPPEVFRVPNSAPARTKGRARTVSHVLGPFSKLEQPCVGAVLDAVLEGIHRLQRQSFERAGTWINGFRYDLESDD